ncbi:MAG: hypothetical protein Q9216_003941 [Gyalolechia sp. 2 TL-2023]
MKPSQAQSLLGSHFGQVSIPASYDYVVIGGGTAGLTTARRLAQNHSVAVIEAGSLYELDNGNFSQVPADASYYLGKNPTFYNPLIDWRQKTTPQPGFGGASVYYPQGKTLGGNSARNFMWYQRGSIGSYQLWADQVGDPSYTYTNFLPFLKKSVKFTGPDQVSYPAYASPAASLLSRGFNALGLKELPGMSSGNLLGWTWITNTIDPTTQDRSTSESAFLREALRRNGNLITYRSSLAKRILFDEAKRATGVQVESGGIGSGSVAYTINATKEFILCSSSFRSPQLLMVSGVDPASTLKEQNIDVLADRPGDALAMEKLPNGALGSQTRSDLDSTFGPDWPDIELIHLDAYSGRLDDLILGAPDTKNYTAVIAAIIAPFSRGNVTITSNDTNDYPVVDPNWLSDARDREVAIAAFKRTRAVFKAKEVQLLLVGSEAFPGDAVQTDEQILQFISSSSSTIHHAAGTNRIGRSNDPMAVVDSRGKSQSCERGEKSRLT